MKMATKRTAGRIIAALALASASSGAWAASYAYSYSNFSAFDINFSGAGSLSQFTSSTDLATEIGSTTSAGSGALDAPPACVGVACPIANNDFGQHGLILTSFSYGDAQIIDPSVVAGSGQAKAQGEVRSSGGVRYASGTNRLVASLSIGLGGSNLSFSMNAARDLVAQLALGGELATAQSTFFVDIQDLTGTSVFNWSPNGGANGITGGTESADPFSLNTVVSAPAVGTFSQLSSGNFAATSNVLGAGTYMLTIEMRNVAQAISAPPSSSSAVPIPPAAWLFASGVVGVAAVSRRRQRAN